MTIINNNHNKNEKTKASFGGGRFTGVENTDRGIHVFEFTRPGHSFKATLHRHIVRQIAHKLCEQRFLC